MIDLITRYFTDLSYRLVRETDGSYSGTHQNNGRRIRVCFPRIPDLGHLDWGSGTDGDTVAILDESRISEDQLPLLEDVFSRLPSHATVVPIHPDMPEHSFKDLWFFLNRDCDSRIG